MRQPFHHLIYRLDRTMLGLKGKSFGILGPPGSGLVMVVQVPKRTEPIITQTSISKQVGNMESKHKRLRIDGMVAEMVVPVAAMVDLIFRDPCEYVKNLSFSFITLS